MYINRISEINPNQTYKVTAKLKCGCPELSIYATGRWLLENSEEFVKDTWLPWKRENLRTYVLQIYFPTPRGKKKLYSAFVNDVENKDLPDGWAYICNDLFTYKPSDPRAYWEKIQGLN